MQCGFELMYDVEGLIRYTETTPTYPCICGLPQLPWMIHRVANAYSCSIFHCYVTNAAYVRNVELDTILQSINPSLLESCSL